jgi:hypothetical protein
MTAFGRSIYNSPSTGDWLLAPLFTIQRMLKVSESGNVEAGEPDHAYQLEAENAV